MKALIRIELKRMSRDKSTYMMSVGMPILLYLIFTTLIEVPEMYKIEYYRDYLMSMTAFSLCNSAIFTFPFDVIQDRENGWRMRLVHVDIRDAEIYFVKMLKMAIIYAVSIIGVFLVGALIKGVSLTMTQWFISGAALLLGGFLFLGMGMIFTVFKNVKTASVLGNILYLSMSALGGLWMPTDTFPEWLQPFSKALPTYQFRELAVNYLKVGKFPINSFLILMSYCVAFIVLTVLINRKRREDVRN